MLSGHLRKWLRATGVLASLAVLVSACGGTASTGPTQGGTLYTSIQGSSVNFTYVFPVIPFSQFSEANIAQAQQLMYRPLLWVGSNIKFDWSKSIASSITTSSGNTVFTIKLHHNWTWSDGKPVTASDVLYEWNLIKAYCPSASNCSWAEATSVFPFLVTSFTVVNPYEFTMTLSKAVNPSWFEYNDLAALSPLPAQTWSKDPVTGTTYCNNYCATPANATKDLNFLISQATHFSNPIWKVADGPFTIGPWVNNGSFTFYRNNHFTGGPKANVSKVVYLFFASDQAEYTALKSGELDIGYVPSNLLAQRKAIPGFSYWQVPDWGFVYFVVNQGSLDMPGVTNKCETPMCKIFNMVQVRQAIQMAIDQPTYITNIFHGVGYVTNGSVPVTPNTYVSSYAKTNHYPYSLSNAKSLLESVGFQLKGKVMTYEGATGGNLPPDGTPFTFNMLYVSGSVAVNQEMLYLQAALKQIGITMNLSTGQFGTVITTACQAAVAGTKTCPTYNKWAAADWGGGWLYWPDILPTGGELYQCGAGSNSGGYCNSTMDNLINQTHFGSSMSAFYSYENYVIQQLPGIELMPTGPILTGEVKHGVGGYQNAYNAIGFTDWSSVYLPK